jgi:hypothetical protein
MLVTSASECFMAACLAGRARAEDAPLYIERWQATVTDGTPLGRYLGLTDAEWALYMEAEGNLAKILSDRTLKRYPAAKAAPRRGWLN